MLRLKKAEMAALMNSTIHLELSSDEQPLSDGEEALENSHIVKFKNQGLHKALKEITRRSSREDKICKEHELCFPSVGSYDFENRSSRPQ
ncbi:hypothetical protein AtNW77_Chr4g0276311 [Arabidopsis thaliana]